VKDADGVAILLIQARKDKVLIVSNETAFMFFDSAAELWEVCRDAGLYVSCPVIGSPALRKIVPPSFLLALDRSPYAFTHGRHFDCCGWQRKCHYI
jgi:hypothetical protein